MYAVIFSADINEIDDVYTETAARMRHLAMEEHGCLAFNACTEGNKEIAVSYWPSLAHIQAWKNNAEHQVAQKLGQERWYANYDVKVVEVLREYVSE